jgi:uncharacterized protein
VSIWLVPPGSDVEALWMVSSLQSLVSRIRCHGLRKAQRFARVSRRLHNEFMKLVQGQRDRIADICRRYNVRRLSLFGSAAMGTERPDSDVDLLVEFVPGQAPGGFALVDMQDELVKVFDGRRVDLAFPSVLRNPWRRKMIEPQLQPIYQ